MNGLLSLLLAASVGPVAFKAPGGFVVTSRAGTVLKTIQQIGGRAPQDLAVSPDGTVLVFTAIDPKADQPLLFKSHGDEAPILLGRPFGFHAQPTFTNDGVWIFFIHHPDRSGGPQGAHGVRAYGQVWKVKLDGSELQQVTTTDGCKLYPDARSSKLVVMTHADCKVSSVIERIRSGRTMVLDGQEFAHARLPRLSPDGSRVAFVGVGNRNFAILVSDEPGKRVQRIPLDTVTQPNELAWAEPRGLLVQLDSRLVLLDESGASTELLDLSGVLP